MLIFAVVMLVAALVLSLLRERAWNAEKREASEALLCADLSRDNWYRRWQDVARQLERARSLADAWRHELYAEADRREKAEIQSAGYERLYRAWEQRHFNLVQKIRSVGAEG